MSIKQQPHRFCSRDRSAAAVLVDYLGDGRNPQVVVAADLIAFANNADIFNVDRLPRVNRRQVIVIRQNPAPIWINAGIDRGAADNRRAWINRVMIAKRHAIFREPPKRGRVLLANKIRTHPIPDHNHHVSILPEVGAIALNRPRTWSEQYPRCQ